VGKPTGILESGRKFRRCRKYTDRRTYKDPVSLRFINSCKERMKRMYPVVINAEL